VRGARGIGAVVIVIGGTERGDIFSDAPFIQNRGKTRNIREGERGTRSPLGGGFCFQISLDTEKNAASNPQGAGKPSQRYIFGLGRWDDNMRGLGRNGVPNQPPTKTNGQMTKAQRKEYRQEQRSTRTETKDDTFPERETKNFAKLEGAP